MPFRSPSAAVAWWVRVRGAISNPRRADLEQVRLGASRPQRRPGLSWSMVTYLDVGKALGELSQEEREAVLLEVLAPEERRLWGSARRRAYRLGMFHLRPLLKTRGLLVAGS